MEKERKVPNGSIQPWKVKKLVGQVGANFLDEKLKNGMTVVLGGSSSVAAMVRQIERAA